WGARRCVMGHVRDLFLPKFSRLGLGVKAEINRASAVSPEVDQRMLRVDTGNRRAATINCVRSAHVEAVYGVQVLAAGPAVFQSRDHIGAKVTLERGAPLVSVRGLDMGIDGAQAHYGKSLGARSTSKRSGSGGGKGVGRRVVPWE